ncbi:MAG TPA: macrolide ABC transporter ATP-binding protein [Verrucomicrobia bacterium]|nr:macrolide ABC transporter ATP-binding protein [Verrucomicrobiota bacterium]
MAEARQERLRLEGVRKAFRGAAGEVEVLRGVSLALGAGEFGVITGPSGSGKTTLLMVAGLLQAADGGTVWFDGREVSGLGEDERTEIRKHGVGMVFQKFCLLPHRSALDNVMFRFRYLDHPVREALRLSEAALERVGLATKAKQAARLLSAGEMQRVAIARALALPPKLLLADEPTGNLDPDSAARVMELFHELNREGMSMVLVTHNPEWVASGTTHWTMRDGHLARG